MNREDVFMLLGYMRGTIARMEHEIREKGPVEWVPSEDGRPTPVRAPIPWLDKNLQEIDRLIENLKKGDQDGK